LFHLLLSQLVEVKTTHINGQWDTPELLDVTLLLQLHQLLVMLLRVDAADLKFFLLVRILLNKELSLQILDMFLHITQHSPDFKLLIWQVVYENGV